MYDILLSFLCLKFHDDSFSMVRGVGTAQVDLASVRPKFPVHHKSPELYVD